MIINKILKWFKKPVSPDYIEAYGIKIFPEDIELINLIREIVLVKHQTFVIHPPTTEQVVNAMAYQNAKKMIKVGISQQEVLEKTGFWIEEK